MSRSREATVLEPEGQAVARKAVLPLEDEQAARILLRDTKADEWLSVPNADKAAEES